MDQATFMLLLQTAVKAANRPKVRYKWAAINTAESALSLLKAMRGMDVQHQTLILNRDYDDKLLGDYCI